MVTLSQAREYLQSQGLNIPDFVLTALVEQANSIETCLAAHYTPGTALLIQLYLLSLMGLGQGDMYVSSQSAPSGASRSFRYVSFADRWKGAASLLAGLDVHGCAASLTPADPNAPQVFGGMWTVRAIDHCGG